MHTATDGGRNSCFSTYMLQWGKVDLKKLYSWLEGRGFMLYTTWREGNIIVHWKGREYI